MAEKAQPGARRFYGRRRGHRLSPRKQRLIETLLPRLRLDLDSPAPKSLAELFEVEASDVWLEIGFGAGEHLAHQATLNPEVGMIGCEPFINGVAALLAGIEERRLSNIRIHDDDARDVLAWLPPASLGRVFILFPDPWPKKRHRRRRLVRGETLAAIARVLRPGGGLRLATDSADYAAQMLRELIAHPAFAWTAESPRDWREQPKDWPGTRYETKARRQGSPAYFLDFRRV